MKFFEESVHFRTLVKEDEKRAAYRLRHQVFAEELGWVPDTQDEMEIDIYDKDCTLVGVFIDDRLIAVLRILFSYQKFMIENEFKDIIGGHDLCKSDDTIEVTRFCVAPDVRRSSVVTKYGTFPIVMVLEKAFYNWCRLNGMDTVYMVVSKHFFRLLNLLGMPCTAIGPEVKMSDGVIAIAAISSWTAFEKHNEKKKPSLLAWFQDTALLNPEELAA